MVDKRKIIISGIFNLQPQIEINKAVEIGNFKLTFLCK
jgi:hypothetical protein